MHLLRLVLIVAFVVALSVAIPTSANEISMANSVKSSLIKNAALSGNEGTRELTNFEEDEEERNGGGRGGRGGRGRRGTGGYYGTNTHLGFWNTNSISEGNKKCVDSMNWFTRLFKKVVKGCPKKKDDDEYARHLRA
ncbi:hypothetical protein DVH05_017798 [Phytophthora capsici]|nr:hypothetical protein DVH05_017798 [Phytophthora capsici]